MRNNGTVGGNVNIPYKDSASYRGLETDTARVTVDNTAKTIAVDVTDGVTEEQLSEIVATLASKSDLEGLASETDLQNAIDDLSDDINAELDNKQAILIPGDGITIDENNVISATGGSAKRLPNLEIQFANYYEESPKFNPVEIHTETNYLNPGSHAWFDFINEILETYGGECDSNCFVYMNNFPGKSILCRIEVGDINGQSFIRVASIADPMGSYFTIRYDDTNGRSYDFNNWIGVDADTRLIIFNEDTNEITLNTVLIPPYVSTADRDIEYRLNNLLTYFRDMIYDKVYPEITFKVVSDNWNSYVSPGEKVYKAQLGLEYNRDNNTYIARISTSDGVYELTFGQELLEEAGE